VKAGQDLGVSGGVTMRLQQNGLVVTGTVDIKSCSSRVFKVSGNITQGSFNAGCSTHMETPHVNSVHARSPAATSRSTCC
jgi:hypothetical protein